MLRLEERIRRYQSGRIAAYFTDSGGEFYAMKLDEFRQLAWAFRRAMCRIKISVDVTIHYFGLAGHEKLHFLLYFGNRDQWIPGFSQPAIESQQSRLFEPGPLSDVQLYLPTGFQVDSDRL